MGDYLFSDEDFVRRLSTENRSAFDIIRDEVRYLCKVAAAGSKEARELEKVRRAFEKAYMNAEVTKNTAEGGVRYSLNNYSEHQIQNWENSKRIVVFKNNEQLTQFIQDSINDKRMDKKMYFGTIPSDLANKIEIETGLNVEKYNLSLGSFEIRKIIKSHGDEKKEIPRGQRAVTKDDFVHIVDVVLNPTKIVLSEDDYMGKPVITFKGNYNGTMNVTAVVSDKRLDVFVQTIFVNVKKENLSTPIDEQASINTPEANNGTVFKHNISHTDNNVKQKQLEIIEKVNPAPDTYHTWIRKVGDIKTLAETLEDSDWADVDEFNPDLTRGMVEETIESGKITIYSSYPIEQGVFVSPSYMEAASYSGDGNVYEKTVKIDDVAWIDPTQGMYANVKEKYSLSSERTTKKYGNVYGEDILLENDEDIGPVREDVATKTAVDTKLILKKQLSDIKRVKLNTLL